ITRCIWSFDTKACTAPDSAKPRISAHSVCQNMKNASRALSPRSCTVMKASEWITARSRLRADEARDRGRRLGDLVLGCRAALADRVGDARVQVTVEELERNGLERLRRGGDLREDVDAVRVVVDHPLYAPHLALDPAQPLADVVLLGGVSRHAPSRWRRGPGPGSSVGVR